MENIGISKVVAINKPVELLSLINDTLEKINLITVEQQQYNKFINFDGCKNALNIIQNNNNSVKQI
jgi:hypothetical protein